MSDNKVLDMLIGHATEVAQVERIMTIEKRNRDYALKNAPISGTVSSVARAMAQTSTPESLSDLKLVLYNKPRHELLVYLDGRSKVNIQSKYPEYFCGHAAIKEYVASGIVVFSANYDGVPYIWKVTPGENIVEVEPNVKIGSRFDVIEVIADPVLDVEKYRVVVIAYGQPTFDSDFTDIDDAIRTFINHLYITEGLEDEL